MRVSFVKMLECSPIYTLVPHTEYVLLSFNQYTDRAYITNTIFFLKSCFALELYIISYIN